MFDQLVTEQRNADSAEMDRLSTLQMMAVMNRADQEVAPAVATQLEAIGQAVDRIAAAIAEGGRLFYLGAGTSGRLGVLDAAECPPTFHTPPEMVQAVIAGGERALLHAVEGAEDDPAQGQRDLAERGFSTADVLVGLAASGRTPYVLGAVGFARLIGAFTVGVSCTPDSELARAAHLAITPVPGPEVLTGSTRLRAGTATKLVLNMISTGAMIRLGYVYGNLMVNVQPTNEKLAARARGIIATLTGASAEQAAELLRVAGDVRVAVAMRRLGSSRDEAVQRLSACRGNLRLALGENEAGEISLPRR